jgi:hypothetical protein
MANYICVTCGTQYADSDQSPEHCLICEDERQYIGLHGQKWTVLDVLRLDHHNIIKTLEPKLTGIGTHPEFAIGQRALLVQSPKGNILWDCISLIDEPTIAVVRALGGISAIAISHPHYYSSMVEWSRVFDAPIYLHNDDRSWVMRHDPAIHFWDEDTKYLWDGISLVRCGGHFTGSTVLHWPAGSSGRGVLLTGDTITVVPDRRHVSFMYSYPNLIPLPARTVRNIASTVEALPFNRIYGAWWDSLIEHDAKNAVMRSAKRYIAALEGIEVV